MKIKFVLITVSLLLSILVMAQDPVIFSQLSNTQITQQDSIVMISSLGEPIGGIYTQNGLVISFEPFPFLILGGVSTGTRDLPAITDLEVFPNPVRDIALLRRQQTNDKYLIRMYQANGSEIWQSDWDQGEASLRILFERYPQGTYMLLVTDEKFTRASHFKIVKQ